MNPLFALLMNIFFQMNGINLPFMNKPNNNMNQNPLMNLFQNMNPNNNFNSNNLNDLINMFMKNNH